MLLRLFGDQMHELESTTISATDIPKHNSEFVVFETMSDCPIHFTADNIRRLSKFTFTSQSVMDIFVRLQNQFYQQLKINVIVLDSFFEKHVQKSSIKKLTRSLLKRDKEIFEHDHLQLLFHILNTNRVEHAFLLLMDFDKPRSNLSVAINSAIRSRSRNKIWYYTSVPIIRKIVECFNINSKTNYSVPDLETTLFESFDGIQEQNHCVASTLLKSLRLSYCNASSIPPDQMPMTNTIYSNYAMILAANARLLKDFETGHKIHSMFKHLFI